MAIAHVQTPAGGSSSGSATSITVSLPSVAAGSLLICVWRYGAAGGRTVTVSDDKGNTWANITSATDLVDGSANGISYAMNGASGTTIVTFAISGAAASLRMAASEYSGAATSNALDQQATATGIGATQGAGNVTPSTDGQLIIASAHSSAGEIYTVGSDFTIATLVALGDNAQRLTLEYYIQPTAAAHHTNITGSGTGETWGAVAVTFKAASTGVSISIPAGGLSLAGLVAAPMLAFNLAIPVGALAFTGYAPTPQIQVPNTSIAIPAGVLTLTGYAPTPTLGGTATQVAIPAGSLVLSGQYVAVAFGGELTVGSLVFTGYAPLVQVSNAVSIAIPAGGLVLGGQVAAPIMAIQIDIPAGAIVYTGLAPSLDAPHVIAIPAGSLVMHGLVFVVSNGGRLGPGDLTTQFVKWLATLPAGDINTRMRDALVVLYNVSPGADLTTLLTRFLRDRTP